jgi:hypothetical protein
MIDCKEIDMRPKISSELKGNHIVMAQQCTHAGTFSVLVAFFESDIRGNFESDTIKNQQYNKEISIHLS